MAAFTIRLADSEVEKLDKLADKLDRSRSYLAVKAIEEFIEKQAWQLAEIEAGLDEAKRGDFASKSELAEIAGKYLRPDPNR